LFAAHVVSYVSLFYSIMVKLLLNSCKTLPFRIRNMKPIFSLIANIFLFLFLSLCTCWKLPNNLYVAPYRFSSIKFRNTLPFVNHNPKIFIGEQSRQQDYLKGHIQQIKQPHYLLIGEENIYDSFDSRDMGSVEPRFLVSSFMALSKYRSPQRRSPQEIFNDTCVERNGVVVNGECYEYFPEE
ncbi:hypothetical protein Avbf_05350, partial [Armadillidium vulgare]